MAKYRVQGPDGKFYNFNGPDGLPQEAANMLAQNFFETQEAAPVMPQPKAETGFIPSVKRGFGQLGILGGDVIPAMLGRAVGADEYSEKQMKEAATSLEELQKKYPSAVPSYKDIDSAGKAYDYIMESIGEAVPTIIPSLITGGAASVIGRGATQAAMNAASQAVKRELTTEAAKMAVSRGIMGGEARQQTLNAIKEIAMKEGVDAARKTALKYEATGTVAGSALQNIPDVYQNIYEETGKQDLGAALAFGSFNAVLDAITPINLLRKAKVSGIPSQEIIGAWYKRAGKGALEGFVTEGATEALQEMSSAAAEKFVDNNKDFFTEKNFERFINSGLKGGIGGGSITGATNVVFGRKAPEVKTPETPETQTQVELTPEEQAIADAAKVSKTTAPPITAPTPSGFDISRVAAPAKAAELLQDEVSALEQVQSERAKKLADAVAKYGAIPPSLSNLQSAYQRDGMLLEEKRKELARITGGEDVGQIDTGTNGAGVPVPAQPSDTLAPAPGAGAVDGTGVGAPRQDAGAVVEGKGKKPSAVTEEKLRAMTDRSEEHTSELQSH